MDKIQRLVLVNQYRILEKVDPHEAEFYSTAREALENGYSLEYSRAFEILSDEISEDECRFVWDTLDLFDTMKRSFDNTQDRSGIDPHRVKFTGFDGNNESNLMGYCRYIVKKLGRYGSLHSGHDDFNSHMPVTDCYRRMIAAWGRLGRPYELSKDQLLAIIEPPRER